MSTLLWLVSAAIVATTWKYHRQSLRGRDLGAVSAQWLHAYRCETHQND